MKRMDDEDDSKGYWTDAIIVVLTYAAIGGMMFFVANRDAEEKKLKQPVYEHQSRVIDSLMHYIEIEDGEPGISLEDEVAFLRKAGISTYKAQYARPLEIRALPFNVLDSVLQVYLADTSVKYAK